MKKKYNIDLLNIEFILDYIFNYYNRKIYLFLPFPTSKSLFSYSKKKPNFKKNDW